MKPNDALLSPSAAVTYELGEISNELNSLCDELDARDKRREAKCQQQEYARKPYRHGFPTVDALGNSICFLDGGHIDNRYWVSMVCESGAHIRKTIGRSYIAIAPTEAEAIWLGAAYGAGLIEPHQTGKRFRSDGWTELRFCSYSLR